MTKLECPVCGASEKKNGEPFGSKQSLISHMQSSTGEHRGIGYQKAEMMIDAEGDDVNAGESEDVTDEEPESNGSVDPGNNGDDPAKAAPQVPEEQGNDDSSGGHPDRSPCCNAELVDFRNKDTWTDNNGIMHDVPFDFACSQCGGGFNHE